MRREEAANKYLDFLENDDREDMEARAKSRGESVENQKELYVVKEEITIPSDFHKGTIFAGVHRTLFKVFFFTDTFVEQTKHEAETWQSVEQDTSQVSFSSLPEDEKSEPSVTVSSTTNTGDQLISALVSTSVTDDPKMEMVVQQKG